MGIIDNDDVLQKFGANLLSLREKAGYSQRQLAARCNTDAADIGRYERAERNPTLTTIVDLARGLDVAPSKLLEGLQ